MVIFSVDLDARIATLMEEDPIFEWSIVTSEGLVMFRCSSHDDAVSFLSQVRQEPDEATANPEIVQTKVYQDYLGFDGESPAQARFCEWALRKLGHVAVFAFDGCNDSGFMLVGENGRRCEGPTLARALYELLDETFVFTRKPLYREAED